MLHAVPALAADPVPANRPGSIAFFLGRGPLWLDRHAGLGLPVTLAEQLVAATGAARDAEIAYRAADADSAGLRQAARVSAAKMNILGRRAIRRIRAAAERADVPAEVYARAQMPTPKVPADADLPAVRAAFGTARTGYRIDPSPHGRTAWAMAA